MKLFISSPLGFAGSTTGFREPLIHSLKQLGFEPCDPWATSPDLESQLYEAEAIADPGERKRRLHDISMKLGERNAENIRACERMLAVLDGVDVDSGTASEIGFAFALGKRIDGLRTDFRRAGENDGVAVNLQVQYWIEASGGGIAQSLDQLNALLRRNARRNS